MGHRGCGWGAGGGSLAVHPGQTPLHGAARQAARLLVSLVFALVLPPHPRPTCLRGTFHTVTRCILLIGQARLGQEQTTKARPAGCLRPTLVSKTRNQTPGMPLTHRRPAPGRESLRLLSPLPCETGPRVTRSSTPKGLAAGPPRTLSSPCLYSEALSLVTGERKDVPSSPS